jgi:hypothetical protein
MSHRLRGVAMQDSEVSAWFEQYNDMFGACGRGERSTEDVLAFYDQAMLVTTSDAVVGPGAQAAADWVQAQVNSMRAAHYDHTEILGRDITVLNTNTALLTGDFSRRRRDGQEVSAFTVTYLIYRTSDGLRIGALALHSA